MYSDMPDMSDALNTWVQPITLGIVTKSIVNFKLVETQTTISFTGVWQPLSMQEIMIKPEGQRAWKWFWLHTKTNTGLKVDDIVQYNSVNYRVKGKNDYSLSKFYEYHLIEDYQDVP